MKIFQKITDLNLCLSRIRQENNGTIGFVPTMGALHNGHLSLLQKAKSENATVVCSVFVNPSQFNNIKDLENYPRTLSRDSEMLSTVKCDILFAPSVEEMYPKENQKDSDLFSIDLGVLDKIMEGKFRPGHFKGVAQVVNRLFTIVKPDIAYFGQKDFQQLAVIRELTRQMKAPIKITGCPIIREENGLAMSSRNVNLSAEERENAKLISQTLFKVREIYKQKGTAQVKLWAEKEIEDNPLMRLEYFELADAETLMPLESWNDEGKNVALMAVFTGGVRLIDNIVF